MQKLALALLLFFASIGGLLLYQSQRSAPTEPTPTTNESGNPAAQPAGRTDNAASGDVTAPQALTGDFRFDLSRLYDLSYQTDAGLVAFAEQNDITVECVIAGIKEQLHGTVAPDLCNFSASAVRAADAHKVSIGVYEYRCVEANGQQNCRTVKAVPHPYEAYTDEELESLALSVPEAAVILARRSEDDSVSSGYYEQAVALSGKAGPLEEWMIHRDLGGLETINGELNVEKASLGYEIYLTTSALGYGSDILSEYEEKLTAAGIDLAPIQEKAQLRLTRINELRTSLVGRPWGDS